MFDQIGRIAAETPFVVEELVQSGIRVWSVNECEQRFDSHTDFLTNYIRFWQADGESKKTSIRTKTALGQMVQEGRFRGRTAPYGYWHEATVGAILKNVMYKGILRSGSTYSKPILHLQIILPEIFDQAQKLMGERVNAKKEERTVPLNTSGQSLLSENVFCGCCGGRLVLTTNGKVVTHANGENDG